MWLQAGLDPGAMVFELAQQAAHDAVHHRRLLGGKAVFGMGQAGGVGAQAVADKAASAPLRQSTAFHSLPTACFSRRSGNVRQD